MQLIIWLSSIPWTWMDIFWLYLLFFLWATFHELGHALMAMLLGTTVTRIQTGLPVMGQFTRGSILLQLGIIPGGSVSYEYADDAPRWKVVAATLSGPLFPVMISAAMFLTAGPPVFTYCFGLIVVVGALVDLWPWKQGSDGQKIFMHLKLIYRGRKTLNV
ncbi:MAG: hypothetical protein XXXJIFNMEKO3_LKCDNKCA_00143 (plasmid) [Candidatus Erwinia impunctatus]